MNDSKLTVRIPQHLLEKAKQYAQLHKTTVTSMIKAYFSSIPQQSPFEDAPITARLMGSLSDDISIDDHKKHLSEKYEQ